VDLPCGAPRHRAPKPRCCCEPTYVWQFRVLAVHGFRVWGYCVSASYSLFVICLAFFPFCIVAVLTWRTYQVPPPLVVPKPPITFHINGKGGSSGSSGEEEESKEKVLIPVKVLDTLEEMNRNNKADLEQVSRVYTNVCLDFTGKICRMYVCLSIHLCSCIPIDQYMNLCPDSTRKIGRMYVCRSLHLCLYTY